MAAPANLVKRGASRSALHAQVGLRRSGLNGFRVRILDASPQGCKTEFIDRPTVDERIWIKFDGLEAIEGIVRWVKEHACGVHFNHPLHDAVFAKILAEAQQAAPTAARPRRMRRVRMIRKVPSNEVEGMDSVTESWLEPRTRGRGERHPDDRACYVMQGTLCLRVNGERLELSRGDYAIVPAGASPDFANETEERAGFVMFTVGSGSKCPGSKVVGTHS